jgi:hypothetical protein
MGAPLKEVTLSVMRILEDNKDTLGFRALYAGIQNLIPETPTICVTAERAIQSIKGAPTYRHDIIIRMTVFFANLANNTTRNDSNYFQSMEFGEALQDLFNQYRYDIKDEAGNQLLLWSEVTTIETGVARKEDTTNIYRTVTVTLEGYCHEIMPDRIVL